MHIRELTTIAREIWFADTTDIGSLEETEMALFALAQAIEQREPAARGHCERLAVFSLALGLTMKLPSGDLLALYRGSFLHDIGKVSVPDSILFKKGPLDKCEWAIMQAHPIRGEEICRPLKSLAPVLPIVRGHHERWDGAGYPDGLRGEEIPLLARVLQLADIFDALTSPRPYKPVYSPRQALRIMEEETSRGWRDPELMSIFFQLHHRAVSGAADFAAGTWREAKSGQVSLFQLQRHLVQAYAAL